MLGINDIPEGSSLSAKQEIQRRSVMKGNAEIDKAAVREFWVVWSIQSLFLILRLFKKRYLPMKVPRPYRQIPFQFSVHILDNFGSDLKHFEYLADTTQDPRNDFMDKLVEVVPDTGTIMVYNASFEKSRIRNVHKHEPRFQPWVDAVLDRFVDLWKPF